jgi:hypothetical protein
MLLVVEAVITAIVVLNLTTWSPGLLLKFVPDIITDVPIEPLVGLKDEMVGDGNTVKSARLVIVTPLVVIAILPVAAPAGTLVVMLLAFEAVTIAVIPLNDTTGEGPKLVPLMVTVAPIAPLAGENPLMVGVGRTVKFDPLLTVTPLTVNDTSPVVEPTGTDVERVVAVAEVTTAVTPLKVTRLLDAVVLKLVPEMVTTAPTAPDDGLRLVMVGDGKTVKSSVLMIVTPLTATETFPVLAPAGTLVVILFVVEEITVAIVPLNLTTLLPGVVLKFVPEITTLVPTAPFVGLNPEIVGVGKTIKFDALGTVTPLLVTDIGPVSAPTGTVVLMLVAFDDVTMAATPLNETMGEPSKLVPEISTEAPTAPLPGVKPEIVGEPRMVNGVLLSMVTPLTVNEINPVVAPTGTRVVMLVAVEAVTFAVVPLNVTSLFSGVVLKLVPVMVTILPIAPDSGEKLVIVGVPNTVKFVTLVIVTPLLDT